jgi:hypothetical protein
MQYKMLLGFGLATSLLRKLRKIEPIQDGVFMAEKYRTSATDYYPSIFKTNLLPFTVFYKQTYYSIQISVNRVITLRDFRGLVPNRRGGSLLGGLAIWCYNRDIATRSRT